VRWRLALAAAFSVSVAAAVPITNADLDPPTLPVVPIPPPPPAPVPAPAPVVAANPVNAVDTELDRMDQTERELKAELADLSHDAEGARARTILRGRAYVRLARAGLLPVGGGFQSLVDHATRVERVKKALARDVQVERGFAERRIAIGKELERLRQKRAPVEVQAKALAHARDALLEAQDRQLAFQRAFESGNSHTAVYGAGPGPVDPSELARGFASMKGRVPFPIPGRAELHSSRRPGTDGPGIEMRAPKGTPVRAVYPGRVAFADEYAAYGKAVIVDHGDSYYTVSANLSEFAVRVGDDVTGGTRIGTVGDMGQGTMLYFEIRMGTGIVDPAEWFGI
jgi:murein DD-endopeptidase MepM/ murein hydrolase activator NlpD